MAVTTTAAPTLREAMNTGDPQAVATVAQVVGLGTMLAVVKVVFAGLTAAAALDITTAAAKTAATVTGITLATGENLPPIGSILAVRVTAGAAAAGGRLVLDSGGTPAAGACTVSDTGKTLTFEGTVTGLVLMYRPAPTVALSTTTSVLGAP